MISDSETILKPKRLQGGKEKIFKTLSKAILIF